MTRPSNRPPARRNGRSASSAAWQRALGWRSRDILRAVALAIALYYVLQLAWRVSPVLLTGFLGVLFGLALASAVDRLEQLRVPRAVGAGGIVLLFLGALYGVGAWVAPTVRAQATELREQLPEAIDRAERWLEARSDGFLGIIVEGGEEEAPAGAPAGGATVPPSTSDPDATEPDPADASTVSLREAASTWLRGAGGYVRPILSTTAAVVTGLLLVTFVAVYYAVEPRTYREGLLLLVPHGGRDRAREVMGATGVVLRRWLVAQLAAMLIVGVVTTGALLLLDVEAAVALGVLAGLLEFVPYAGPIIAAVPAIAMGFLDSPEKALWVAGVYLVIQQLESNILQPILMREGLEVPPILTIVAQGIMALLFGFLGVLVAVPLLAAIVVPVKMLYVQDVMGDDVSVLGVDDDEEDGNDEEDGADGDEKDDGS